jgi:glycosyltransferase involved in cell wall biosynthesis
MMKEIIYIMTPSFNSVRTISQTIESILAQNTNFFVHYHIQDGFSSDGTQELLDFYEKKVSNNPNIYTNFTLTWSSERDAGMYDAISTAVEKLSIPENCFMGWINSDDVLCPECFFTLERVSRDLPEILWVSGTTSIQYMNGDILVPKKNTHSYPQYFLQQGLCDGQHWFFLQQEGTFWKKRLWNDAGGLDRALKLAGDWDLWRRMAAFAELAKVPWPMGIFRRRSGQLSEDMSGYLREIETIIPSASRLSALRKLFHLTDRPPILEIHQTKGKLTVERKPLPLHPYSFRAHFAKRNRPVPFSADKRVSD